MKIVYSDEDITLSLQYVEQYNLYFIHSTISSWSLSKYKKYISVFSKVLNDLNKEGVEVLYAIPPSEKEEKWQKLFGFTETIHMIGKYKLMEIKTWE